MQAVRARMEQISIHALREEGDLRFRQCACEIVVISIHALREEGDLLSCSLNFPVGRFLSTPSARRATYDYGNNTAQFLFLSTPSARRATQQVI